jgi:chemotaxis protein CheD
VVAEPNVMISTLLGSCIAVCLQDPVGHIGGMNHFLLGEPGRDQKVSGLEMQRYGVHAMELLINAMMAKGASRANLRAQVYGGANIIAGLGSIGSSNADFARRFLATEGIAVGHVDTGGKAARKVEFLPFDGRARCTTVSETRVPPIIKPLPVVDGEVELF